MQANSTIASGCYFIFKKTNSIIKLPQVGNVIYFQHFSKLNKKNDE